MTEKIHFSACLAKLAAICRRSSEPVPIRLKPMLAVAGSGYKVFRINPVLFSLWFLFPVSLLLASDWIGLLVAFQAATAAVRLRDLPPGSLAAFSSLDAARSQCEGDFHAR